MTDIFSNLPCDPTTEVFWAMVGAVGQILGAIATFFAVLVALWQSYDAKKASKPELQITFNLNIPFSGEYIGEPFYTITASNPKPFPIQIMSSGVKLGNKNIAFIDDTIYNHDTYPKKLNHGEHTTATLYYRKLAEDLHAKGYRGKQKCYIYFSDSLNNEYKKSFTLNIDDEVNRGN